jgi:hypothetical protein
VLFKRERNPESNDQLKLLVNKYFHSDYFDQANPNEKFVQHPNNLEQVITIK